MGLVSAVPSPLATAAQFQRFFPELCREGPGADANVLAQTMVEATAFVEESTDRRLAPFSGYTETGRLYGIDPDEYGASTDNPLDIYGSLGLSQAAAYQDDNLVRKFWITQTAPHYPDLWTVDVTSLTLYLTYGSTIAVDPGSLEGPHPDTGEIRMRLGTFAPEGTNYEVTYSGGYTVAIPASLQRLCRFVAAKMLILDMEPQDRKGADLNEIESQITMMMANWARA